MMPEDLVAYIDGECSDEQATRIEQALEQDQKLRTHLAVLIRQRLLLAEVYDTQHTTQRAAQGVYPTTSNRPISSTTHRRVKNSNRHKGKRTRGFNPLVPAFIVIAACLMLTVLLIRSTANQPPSATRLPELAHDVATPPPPTRLVIAAIGPLLVLRGSMTLQTATGDGLFSNDVLEAKTASGLRYSDGSTMTLTAGSRLELKIGNDGGKQLLLHKGEITAEVTPQTAAAPLRIITNLITATVAGTRLSVKVSDHQSRVAVIDGLVQVQDINSGPIHDIPAGGWAEARPGIPLQVSSGPAWSITGQWSRLITGGEVIHDQAGKEIGVRSINTLKSQLKTEFKPDQYICIQSGEHGSTDRYLMQLSKDFVVVLHLHAERAGRILITLAPEPGSAASDFRHDELDITVGWNHVMLPSSRFMTEVKVVPNNYPLWALVIWAFETGQIELTQASITNFTE